MRSLVLALTVLFCGSAFAGESTTFSDGIKAADVLGIDTNVTTMEKRDALDLSKYGITAGNGVAQVKGVKSQRSIRFQVQNRRNFQNQRNAFAWCDDIHRFSGTRNTCVVRQFGNNFYEANFRFMGTGRGDTFGGVFQNIFRFLQDSGLLNRLFDIIFDQISD